MSLETGCIKEIAPGVFHTLLWCPEGTLLAKLLDATAPFVLCWAHQTGSYVWRPFHLPVAEPSEAIPVLSRVAEFDFVIPTPEFLRLLPSLRPALKAVQLRTLPPDYLDLSRIRGKERFRLLAACGWHVLIDTPANDYGQVMSPHRHVVERAIAEQASLDASA